MNLEQVKFMIKELSVSLYTELPDQDKHILSTSLLSLLQTDPNSVINHLDRLYTSLSEHKSSIKHSNLYKKFSENENYQAALQKLDSEIRGHIKHEFQMKVFLDTLQEKIKNLTLNHQPKDPGQVQKLIEENEEIQNKINEKKLEIKELKKISKGSEEFELLCLKEKVAKEAEKISDFGRRKDFLLKKYSRVKIELDLVVRESNMYQAHNFEMKTVLDKVARDKSLSRSGEKVDLTRESVEVKSVRVLTPNRVDRSISPVPLTYKQKIMNLAKNVQGRKTELSPLQKVLHSDQSKSKLKPAFHVYSKKF